MNPIFPVVYHTQSKCFPHNFIFLCTHAVHNAQGASRFFHASPCLVAGEEANAYARLVVLDVIRHDVLFLLGHIVPDVTGIDCLATNHIFAKFRKTPRSRWHPRHPTANSFHTFPVGFDMAVIGFVKYAVCFDNALPCIMSSRAATAAAKHITVII